MGKLDVKAAEESHDEMLETLKKAQSVICEDCDTGDMENPSDHSDLCFDLAELIAEAEGREE